FLVSRTPTCDLSTLSLHDALPISVPPGEFDGFLAVARLTHHRQVGLGFEDHPEAAAQQRLVVRQQDRDAHQGLPSVASTRVASTDRKSTRLNSSHVAISYAVFCLK